MPIGRVVAILASLKLDQSFDVGSTQALERAISHLNTLQTALVTQEAVSQPEWISQLRHDFDTLHALGIWPESTELVLKEVEEAISSSHALQTVPMEAPEQQLPDHLTNMGLPEDLLNLLKEAWFLHTLAKEPDRIVPPGKSILSMLTGSRRSEEQHSDLQERVEYIMHDLFWEEATGVLSDPLPSVVLQRLKLLYTDLYAALSSLIPPEDPAMAVLTLPISPTSSPLHSALINLGEIVASLRRRCAPVRDIDVEAIQRPMDEYNPASPSTSTTLPKLITDTIRSILKLAEVMKEDLNTFVLGNMGEEQLVRAINVQSKHQERALLEAICGTKSRLLDELKAWLRLDELPAASGRVIVIRLLEALRSKHPVGCVVRKSFDDDLPAETAPENILPSFFLFVSASLLYAQNYLQAIVITASLRSLVRLPAQDSRDMTGRLLALLRMEAEDEDGDGGEPTKLINLADEVVHAMKKHEGGDETRETQLREAINRTLSETDPVFLLLQRRVMDAIGKALNQHLTSDLVPGLSMPSIMQSGSGPSGSISRPKFSVAFAPGADTRRKGVRNETQPKVEVVKGFEDPSLSQAIEAVARQIWGDVEWAASVWVDLITL